MYRIKKTMEIAGSHDLDLPYESKCSNVHGHNWVVTIECECEELTSYGMVIDFTNIKNEIHKALDHKHINDVMLNINPTAENMAKWIYDKVNDIRQCCKKVSVQESSGNIAEYIG